MKLEAVALSLLVAVSLSDMTHARTPVSKLLGQWAVRECSSAKDGMQRCDDAGAYSLAFKEGGVVEVTTVFRNGLGKGQAEGFAAEGRYRLAGKRLIITRPGRAWEAWPSRDGKTPRRYSCGIVFESDAQSFRLHRCLLSGVWVRQAHQP